MRIDSHWLSRFTRNSRVAGLLAIVFSSAFCAHAMSAEMATASRFTELLERQGWRSRSDADGSVYYHPPRPTAVTPEAVAPPAPAVAQADIARLLLERGWRVETTVQGDMLLFPVRPPAPVDIDRLLRERGWRILTDVEGNTLLMPMAAAVPEPTGAGDRVQTGHAQPAAVDQPVTGEPGLQFRQALEDRGWTVRTGSDGSMILYPAVAAAPPSPAPEAQGIAGRGYCEGIVLAGEEVEPPIDSEQKARLLSVAWIALFGQAGHEVGETSRIDPVFVVGIVDSEPPHTLRNQLLIRDDGSLIALY